MKEIYISNLKKDMEITEFFMIKSISVKTGSTGKPYLDVTLADKTGEISAKKWEVAAPDQLLKEKDMVKVLGLVTEFNSQNQLRIQRIRKLSEEEERLEIDKSDFIKAAPENPEDMYNYIMEVANSLEDSDLRNISVKVLNDNRDRLMYYPAASKNHHAEFAGLLYHMKRMLSNGEKVCEVYEFLNKDLVLCGVILHDIEKLNEILSDEDGVSSGYSFEGQMLGHLVMGVKYIDRLGTELNIPEEKRIMLEHMSLSHHYEPEFGSPKKPLFPEAEVLHYLDILDAKMFDMEQALSLTNPGTFSEKVWTLDGRRIYRPEE